MWALHFEEFADRPTNLIYRGSSMSPTLKSPALLDVVPYRGRNVQCGDVIAFYPPHGEETVVHRVVSRDAQGIKTRGDASGAPDPYVLNLENIIGQVVCARSGSKQRRIRGGRLGGAIGRWLRIRAALKRGLAVPLRSAYHLLGRSGIFRLWIPARLRTKILAFNRPGGTELHLLMGKRLIGRLPVGEASWKIKPPYRLFVDERDLPRGDRESPRVSSDPTPRSRCKANSCHHTR